MATVSASHSLPPPDAALFATAPRAYGSLIASPVGGPKLFWPLQLGYWTVALAANLLLVAGLQKPKDSFLFLLLEIVCCGLATAAIRGLVRSRHGSNQSLVAEVGMIAGAAIVATLLVTGVLQATSIGLGLPPSSMVELGGRMTITLVMISHWCGLYFGYQLLRRQADVQARALQAEAVAARSELERLQSHVSPHFLFNALNTVLACRDDPAAIDRVTEALADYLRVRLRPEAPLVPLSQELDAVEDYLTIQAVRFGAGLVPRIDCDIDARSAAVPPAAVQALVENAIKYGFETAAPPIAVEVEAGCEAGQLVVAVSNTGAWVEPDPTRTTGTGLATLAGRLGLLFGPEATLGHAAADGRVRVVMRLSLRRLGEPAPREAAP